MKMNSGLKNAFVYVYLFTLSNCVLSSELLQDLINRLDKTDAVNNLLSNKIEQLENREKEHIKSIEYLTSEIDSLKSQGKTTVDAMEGFRRVFTNSSTPSAGSEGTFLPKRHAGTTGVAFWATISHDLLHLTKLQNIHFDKIITNVGNAYNAASGEFTAPQSGIYVFATTLLAYPLQSDHFRIVKNGQQLALMFVSQHSTDTAAATFVLQLNQGDRVAIQNLDRDRAVSGDDFSFFSGFLLKSM